MPSGHKGSEKDEAGCDGVPDCLQNNDLAENLKGWELSQRAGAWRAAAPWHIYWIDRLLLQ